MPQYGINWKFNTFILLTWLTIAAISSTNILAAASPPPSTSPVPNETTDSQNFDVIDVAKHQVHNGHSERSKGQTTRIFTTGDVDEHFWLKYLGEEFRHAVHLHVDDDNNVRPAHKEKQEEKVNKANKINDETNPKRTRFVRQSADPKDIEHIPVESSSSSTQQTPPNAKEEYSTPEPEIVTENSTMQQTTETTTTTTPNKHLHKNTQSQDNMLKHDKKILKIFPKSPLKAIHTPIVVHLPQTQTKEYQINDGGQPVVVQMAPVIYHQKAETFPEIYHGHIPNLHTIPIVHHHNTPSQYATPLHYNTQLDTSLRYQYHQRQPSLPHEFAHKAHLLPHYPYPTHPQIPKSLPQMTLPPLVIPPTPSKGPIDTHLV